jgi:predicted dehydrogenase
MNKINTAQIGCGYWGPNLLRNQWLNPRCNIKGVVDLSEERRQFVKSNYPSVDVFDDINAVFEDPEIEAVIIATPAGTHFQLTMQALEAGKHVLVEKPMATSAADVLKIKETAESSGLIVMVGHTFLYNTAVRYLKTLVNSGELGDIRYIYCQRLNLGRVRSDIDALWNLAPHDVSIIQYLLDDRPPLSVSRQGMDYLQEGVDDVVFMDIVYPGKIMAHIHVSWLDPTKVRRMTVVGSKKMVIYNDIADDKIAIYDKSIDKKAILGENMDFDQPGFQHFDYRSGDILLPRIKFDEPLKVEINHFLDCIEKKTPCITGPEHAYEVIRILSGETRAETH